ncbi:hypothetical protein CkaCkLH20_05827 [Colletotrichum karsti]|uniref:Uncharacterized protein n=1 Tax=Colletotrichum karsti TaxID=1095194 RepID=A0A9P6LHL9_9PEZI|nr:uncharacterized protein CkaCkLH20_05827 [Colletotrichum karsti]KAF9876419.1 hypothetical protein CkaCkLH20_05827 [Colletotrichum karsti]
MSTPAAETPTPEAIAIAALEEALRPASAAGISEPSPPSPPAAPAAAAAQRSVPEGVTVVFAERKRTGRVAGNKYKADGTPYKRPGPAPKPLEERAKYKSRGPVKRMERSYTDQRRREVVMFLLNHKVRVEDENDVRGRKNWNGGREDQRPPEEPGYRWATLAEASEWFKMPERTVHSWWKRRDQILGNVPRKLTKVEKRRLAEEEERRKKENEERRGLLEAIGWPREALPEAVPGFESAWHRAAEDARMQTDGMRGGAGTPAPLRGAMDGEAGTPGPTLPPLGEGSRLPTPVEGSPSVYEPGPAGEPATPAPAPAEGQWRGRKKQDPRERLMWKAANVQLPLPPIIVDPSGCTVRTLGPSTPVVRSPMSGGLMPAGQMPPAAAIQRPMPPMQTPSTTVRPPIPIDMPGYRRILPRA